MNEVKLEDLRNVETYGEMQEIVNNPDTKFDSDYTKDFAEVIANKIDNEEKNPTEKIDWENDTVEIIRDNQFAEFEIATNEEGTLVGLDDAFDPNEFWDPDWDENQVEQISKEDLINKVKEEIEQDLSNNGFEGSLSEDFSKELENYIEDNLSDFNLVHTDHDIYPSADEEYISIATDARFGHTPVPDDLEMVADKVAEDILGTDNDKFVENLKNPNDLEAFSFSENEDIRYSVAANENTSPETLDKLADDEDKWVRIEVARNENTSPETLEKLSHDNETTLSGQTIGDLARENPNFPSEEKEIAKIVEKTYSKDNSSELSL